MLDPVSRSRLHEEIVSQIQNRIFDGGFAVGDKLPPERELAQSLHVNRSTVREALKKLEQLGLIEIIHGDGIYVKDYLESGSLDLLYALIYREGVVDRTIMENILEIRTLLVPEMAALAALRRTKDDIEDLERVVNSRELSVAEKDLEVHRIIARASRNMVFIFILNFFNQFYRDYGRFYFDSEKNRRRSERFHDDILDALRKGDGERSRTVMREVLIYSGEQVNAKMADGPSGAQSF